MNNIKDTNHQNDSKKRFNIKVISKSQNNGSDLFNETAEINVDAIQKQEITDVWKNINIIKDIICYNYKCQ